MSAGADAGLGEIVDTAEQAAALPRPPLLVREPLVRFLDEHGLGAGPVEATRLVGGHSNVTYLITRDGERFVLRRPPRPPLPPSAHDVLREARVLRGLAGSGVPVPRVLATCDDESLLGVPFYVMTHLDGVPMTMRPPPGLSTPADLAAAAEQIIAGLAELHAVDPAGCGLDGLGRPDGYLERQVRRFAGLWDRGRTRELPELDAVTDWLRENLPSGPDTTIVHGDFRLGNLLFHRERPARLLGVLDWEMATLGDPLADLGYLTATVATRDRPGNVMTELQPVTREPGFPGPDELAHRYGELTGRPLGALRWYRVLALWKSAIFLEQSYRRYLSGDESDPWFAEMGDGVPGLVDDARREAGRDG